MTYRLKDWVISRQRYWGTPIPVVYCDASEGRPGAGGGAAGRAARKTHPSRGEGGIRSEGAESFVDGAVPAVRDARAPRDGHDGHLRGLVLVLLSLSLAAQDEGPFDAAAARYWFPIDLYVGGVEHAILHLVYARFWTKMMRDLGLVASTSP